MIQRSLHFTRFAAALVAGCGAIACNSLELDSSASAPEEVGSAEEAVIAVEPVTREEQAEIDRDQGRARCHESAGESELSIRWAKAATGSQARLLATVHNNGAVGVSAEPVLVAANSALGEARERRLPAVDVPPGADVDVPVEVTDLPLQSVGQATSVSIGVRWRRSDAPDTDMLSPQALSEELYVTHDESFKTAMVRDVHTERTRQLAALTERGAPRLLAARSLDQRGTLRTVDPAKLSIAFSGLAVAEAATPVQIERRQP